MSYRCGGSSILGRSDLILCCVEIALLGRRPIALSDGIGRSPAVAITVVGVGLAPVGAVVASANDRFVKGGEAVAAVVAEGSQEVEIATGGLLGPLAGLVDVAVVGAGAIGPFEAELVVGGGAAGLEEVGVGADSLALELEEVVVFRDFVEAVAELPALRGSVGGVFGGGEVGFGGSRDYGVRVRAVTDVLGDTGPGDAQAGVDAFDYAAGGGEGGLADAVAGPVLVGDGSSGGGKV